jgi:putative ABC transport system permease protein
VVKSYLKIALRNLVKHKLYSLINVFGLAIGLASCLIVIGHISYEFSFENIHENKDRIYRVNGRFAAEDAAVYSAQVMSPLGLALAEEIPEVEKAAIFRALGNLDLKMGEERFVPEEKFHSQGYEHGENVLCANPDFLEVFSFPLIQGDPKTALSEPFSILITETVADEHFLGKNPVGQIIELNDSLLCQVSGVLKDIPENTQLHCDFIVSYSTLQRTSEVSEAWDGFGKDYAYLLLSEDADPKVVEQKIPAIFGRHVPPEVASKFQFELQPLGGIYFSVYGSGRQGELYPAGEASMIYTMGLVAIFILLLAMANFINLSTAKSADRTREVGVRKVFGAHRKHLIRQFLGESLLITFVSVCFSLMFYEIFKAWAKPLLPREAFADFYTNPTMALLLVALILVVGILAGFYPALYLSRFRPIAVLQSKAGIRSGKSFLRKALVVFQFTIAIGFICTTAIVYKQYHYVTSMDLGFDRKNVLVLKFEGERASDNCKLMKNEILGNTKALAATANNGPPGTRTRRYRGFYTDPERKREDMLVGKAYYVDEDFISMFGLEIIKGRGFSEDMASHIDRGVIINESLIRELEVDDPIGYKLYGGEDKVYEVVGVVKEFHGSTLDWAYRPVSFIMLQPEEWNTLCVKLPSGDVSGSIQDVRNTWQVTLPGVIFDYSFLEDDIRNGYAEYKASGTLQLVLSVITLTIACLGIFGLVSYTAVRRTKEIGIRKVLGATVAGIVAMLSREFVVLIALSNLIAWPLAYLLMRSFLQEFPFQVKIGLDTFVLTGLVAMFLAVLSASFQAIKAALTNPVETLRYE